MPRTYSFAPTEYYHIYSRGVDKRAIFLDYQDYRRFLNLLFLCNGTLAINSRHYKGLSFAACVDKIGADRKPAIHIGAYCLMSNHFHLLVREGDSTSIPQVMKKLLTAYSMYFNLKYKRTGRLFESSFKAKHVDKDTYLRHLMTYIHVNPYKDSLLCRTEGARITQEALREYLEAYQFSSFCDYAGISRAEKAILSVEQFPEYFPEEGDFMAALHEGLWTEDNPLQEDARLKLGI